MTSDEINELVLGHPDLKRCTCPLDLDMTYDALRAIDATVYATVPGKQWLCNVTSQYRRLVSYPPLDETDA